MKTFAVLGAGGFIGYRLTEYLLLNDVGIPRPVVRSFRSMARVSKFELDVRRADATDPAALTRAIERCEAVFHCVAGDRRTIVRSVPATYAACRQAGVRRLIYLSTAVVHGNNPRPGIDEDSPLDADQPYDYNVSKVRAERKLRSLMADGAVECTILRPCIVFGPRSTRWTGQVASEILAGRAYLVDGGEGICNTIFVDDLAEIMALCVVHPAAAGRTFLVKDAERVTWRRFYAAVSEAVGVDPSSIASISSRDARRSARMLTAEGFVDAARTLWNSRVGRAARVLFRSGSTVALAARLRSGLEALEARNRPERTVGEGAEVSRFLVDLQMCQYELPARRLSETLGYRSAIGFEEGSRRTAAWLRFAFGAHH